VEKLTIPAEISEISDKRENLQNKGKIRAKRKFCEKIIKGNKQFKLK